VGCGWGGWGFGGCSWWGGSLGEAYIFRIGRIGWEFTKGSFWLSGLLVACYGFFGAFLSFSYLLILPLFNSSINHRYISCFIPFEGERGGGR